MLWTVHKNFIQGTQWTSIFNKWDDLVDYIMDLSDDYEQYIDIDKMRKNPVRENQIVSIYFSDSTYGIIIGHNRLN